MCGKEKYQNNKRALGYEERVRCSAAESFLGAFSGVIFIYSALNNVGKKKGIEAAPVSQLVIAWSQSVEP